MSALSKDQILDSIASMSVMEVCDLIKMMEDKFGVTAAAPVAVAAAAAGPAAAAAEEQTEFTVHLKAFGENKVEVIKVIRALTNLGLKEAKDLVEAAPSVVKDSVSKKDAEDMKKKLEAAGAQAEIK